MKKLLGGLLIFVAGFGAGSYYAYLKVKEKYEGKFEDDLATMRKYYESRATKTEKLPEEKKEENKPQGTDDIVKLAADVMKERKYTTYSNSENVEKQLAAKRKKEEKVMAASEKPKVEVIGPDDFDILESEGYTTERLTWYEDKYLADENDELIEDIGDIIGWDSLSHMGEYEEDALYVRNNKLKIDFEILADHRKYEDVVIDQPYLFDAYDEGSTD